MLDRVINLRLMAHPLNWLIVWAMVMVWGFLLTTIKGSAQGCGCDNGVPD